MRPSPDRLLDHLRSRQEEMCRVLVRLVEAESPSRDPRAVQGAQEVLAEALRDRGFRVRRFAGKETGGMLLALPGDRPRRRPFQLLLGHSDTVWPVGTVERRPVRIEAGRLRGPGSYDMKGGLVQGVFAMEAAWQASGGSPAVIPVFLITSDEEVGSRESVSAIRRLARCSDRVFVLEPSLGPLGKLKTARKGVGRFVVRVHGRAAHAGLEPEEGASAILELSHVIQKLFALNDLERGITVNVGTIDGGLNPNVVAPESRAVADVRVLRMEDAPRVEAEIHGLEPATPGTRLEVEGRIGLPPMERTAGNRRLWELARAAAAELDLPLEEGVAGGASDGNLTSLHAPTLDGLGAVGGGAHAESEHVVLERMPERAALLARLLLSPALGGAFRGSYRSSAAVSVEYS